MSVWKIFGGFLAAAVLIAVFNHLLSLLSEKNDVSFWFAVAGLSALISVVVFVAHRIFTKGGLL